MSAIPEIGDVVTVRVWASQGPQAAVNTFHYRVSETTGLGADLEAWAEAFDAVIAPLMKPILNNNAVYNGVQAYVNQLPMPLPQSATTNAGAGTGGGVAMSTQTSGLSQWVTAFAGPAGRGRTYWPFPSATDDAGAGVPSTSYLTAVFNAAAAVFEFGTVTEGSSTSTGVLVLKHGRNKAGVTPTPSPIMNFTVVPQWATQKRRGFFGRVNRSPI